MNTKLIKRQLLAGTPCEIVNGKYLLYQCHYCQLHYEAAHLNVDHKTPKSKGGGNDLNNLTLSCKKCNNVKASYSYNEFMHFIHSTGQENYAEQIKTLRRGKLSGFKKKFNSRLMTITRLFRTGKTRDNLK